jgi:hypothetical protein
MVLRIARFQTTEHETGGVVVRLVHFHHLKTALQRSVAFKVLLVFTPGGRRNGAQLATGQRRFQQVRRICAARLIPRANEGMCLIDKQQNGLR